MGLATYLFFRKDWERIYVANCSAKTPEEWAKEAPMNVPLGIWYIMMGVCCELLYLPFIIVMLKKEYIQHSCYKFMFLLSLIDICVLPCNAIFCGLQSALGLHFCHAPNLVFIFGVVGTTGWYGASMTCVILGFDRFLEMCKPTWAKVVFKGKIMYFWLAFPVVYMVWSFFNLSAFYNNNVLSYHFDPYAGTKGMQGSNEFAHFAFHVFHNFFVSIALGTTYIGLCIVLMMRAKMYKEVNISRHQKLMTLQSVCICFEIFVAALVYIYNQFFYIPPVISAMAHVAWIFIHGDTPIVYLFLNASLRKSVIRLLMGFIKHSPIHAINSIMQAPSYFPHTNRSSEKYESRRTKDPEDNKF